MGLPAPSFGSGYGSSATRRPPPRSYEEAQDQEAQDLFRGQRTVVQNDRTRAGSERDRTGSAADRALSSFNAGGPRNTQAFQPLNIEGYSPSQLASWQTAAQGAAGMMQGGMQGGGRSSVSAGGAGALQGFDSRELRDFNADDVSGYDPSAYGQEFAQGAYGDFKNRLGDELDTLEKGSVGAGRLRTGFFDEDQGGVVTRVGADFSNRLAQAATEFSGQRLSALTSGAGMRLDRARGIDANALSAAQGMDANAIAAGEAQDRYSLSAGDQSLDRDRMGLDAALAGDEAAYRRASDMDRYGFDRATYLDDSELRRGETGLDAALSREGRYMDDYHRNADREAEYLSANREWAASDLERAGPRPVAAERVVGGTPYRPPYNANRELAAAYGVPYKG